MALLERSAKGGFYVSGMRPHLRKENSATYDKMSRRNHP